MRWIFYFSPIFLFTLLAADPKPPLLRLPQSVRPVRYAADLTLDPKQDTFRGELTILITVNEPVSTLWLNATGLEVKTAEYDSGGLRQARILPGGEDFVGLGFDDALPRGPARLKLSYEGKINRKSSAGIFGNKFQNDFYLFTQFEPFDARRAFPCFDEPGFKVPWQLTLRVPERDQAFANTPVQSEKIAAGQRIVQFAETKPLPSYLIAFAVGPFETVDGGRAGKNKVPVRIIVPRGAAGQAGYAASVTAEILTRLEDYFGIPYPYEKSDSIAVPISFGGAMENPGLVTYDQPILLAKPEQNTTRFQRGYAGIAAHELAHQWFGDYVTLAWWNDTWLNEAFATWLSSKLIAGWKPEWETDVDEQSSRNFAMMQDSLVSARRINQPVESKSDIANAFDGITYQKGGAVIRMFESAMGEQKFRDGVRTYLKQHAHGNARAEDFLAALARSGGKDIAPAFSTFLNQPGVPELTVAVKCVQGRKPVLTMAQRRLLPLGSAGSVDQTWQVPVCVEYAAGSKKERQCTMLTAQTSELELRSAPSCPDWILANAGETGYYRVNYQGELLHRLLMHRADLSLAEQVGVLGDVVALTGTGTVRAEDALAIVPTVKDDPRRQIVSAAINIAGNLANPRIVSAQLKPNRVRFVQAMFGERARRLGWQTRDSDTEDDRLLRPRLAGFVADAGEDPELIASAKKLAVRWLSDRTSVSGDVVGAVLSTAARNGDAALYEQFLAAAKREQDPRDRQRLISGLAAFADPALVRRNQAFLLDGTFDIRESAGLLMGSMSRPEVERMPYEFVKSHFDELAAKMPSSLGSNFLAFLPMVAGVGCSEADRAEAEAFFKPRMESVTGGPRNLSQTLERIHLCEAHKQAQQASVERFLRRY